MKPFKVWTKELTEEAGANIEVLKTANNTWIAMHNGKVVGHIEFIPGVPGVIAKSRDRYGAYYLGSYRDGRLKLRRSVSRLIGVYNSQELARDAIRRAVIDGQV